MKIETKHKNTNVLSTALLIHIVTIFAAPAVAAGSILFMGNHRGRSQLFEDLFESKHMFNSYILMFSAVGIFVVTAAIYHRNRKKRLLVAIEFEDEESRAILHYKTFYNNTIRRMSLPYANINLGTKVIKACYPETSTDQFEDKKIIIYNGPIYACEIPLGGSFWHKEGALVRMITDKISALNKKL